MKIGILSDTHGANLSYAHGCDVVIFAGDAEHGDPTLVGEYAPCQFFVPGNHDHYTSARLQGRCWETLERTIMTVTCGGWAFAFYGIVGWSDFVARTDPERIRRGINDFIWIPGMTPDRMYELYQEERAWLASQKREGDINILVSHFAPFNTSIAPQYATHPLTPYFWSDHDTSMFDVVIHGHTHTAFDYMRGDTRVVCNPHGYPHEATGYIPNLTIDV